MDFAGAETRVAGAEAALRARFGLVGCLVVAAVWPFGPIFGVGLVTFAARVRGDFAAKRVGRRVFMTAIFDELCWM